jgi:tRNA threonylcarbamoyladenosine biosynthesis protein TsaB
MNVLAFDTASPTPAIVLLRDGRAFEERLAPDRRASEQLLPGVERILRAAAMTLSDCARIAVCSGPGSFTGVRVGLATAWGLGRAIGVPVETVPTLEALAEGARGFGLDRVAAALDAGRGEVVVELFSLAQARARSLGAPERLRLENAVARCTNFGVASLPRNLLGPGGLELTVSPARGAALAVARAPRETGGAHPVALYSRASAAEEKLGSS